jgi:hypothetical protein
MEKHKMQLVTERDMADARALAERAGLEHMDDFQEFIHDIAQSIADGRRSDPLPWDAGSNRHYEPVEQAAKQIYDSFVYDGAGQKPPWTPNGNGIKQDEARMKARALLRRDGHKPTNDAAS